MEIRAAVSSHSVELEAGKGLRYSAEKRWMEDAMAENLCSACNMTEVRCQCDKYCILCKSDERVRLCQDGCYYCGDCREVCEFSVDELQLDD
jgi:hypothetical protein